MIIGIQSQGKATLRDYEGPLGAIRGLFAKAPILGNWEGPLVKNTAGF